MLQRKKQIPEEKREDFYKLANDVIKELDLDKKWEEMIEQKRYAKERALEGERLFKRRG